MFNGIPGAFKGRNRKEMNTERKKYMFHQNNGKTA